MAGGQNMHTLTKVDVTVRGWAPGILRRSGAAAAGAALVLGLLATGAPAASATTSFTLYVNQSGTSITGCASAAKACKTIAEGITAASLLSGDDVTVDVAASKTHYDENLVFGDTSNPTLTIKGAGAATTTLDGTKDGNSDVVVSFGVVTISGLAIVNGVSGDPGGGVENGATLSLTDDSLTGDTGSYGGAIHNTGSLTLTGDTLSNDTGSEGGGALYNQGIATLDHDTFTSDSGYDGDAVFNNATVTGTLSTTTPRRPRSPTVRSQRTPRTMAAARRTTAAMSRSPATRFPVIQHPYTGAGSTTTRARWCSLTAPYRATKPPARVVASSAREWPPSPTTLSHPTPHPTEVRS
jgi:hypothetical protein